MQLSALRLREGRIVSDSLKLLHEPRRSSRKDDYWGVHRAVETRETLTGGRPTMSLHTLDALVLLAMESRRPFLGTTPSQEPGRFEQFE